MPVKQTIPYNYGTFFITFTCYQWLWLIDIVNGYDIVYGWFDHLKSKEHFINGYAPIAIIGVPNHVHVLISFINSDQSINTIIGNGKRFMAYEIIERLEQQAETKLLETLGANIELKRRLKNKQHNVWELSFDWKECIGIDFIWQKLNYMHNNPCTGKWQLAANAIEYKHSSAKFYLTGEQGVYPVTNFMEMLDIDLRHGKSN